MMTTATTHHIRAIDGGITAAEGVRAAGVACGIKRDGLDLAVILADRPVSAAALFTTNLAKAAPVVVSAEHLVTSGGVAQAIVINSGCANAGTGTRGVSVTRDTARSTGALLGCEPEQVLIASTGVIGVDLDPIKIERGLAEAIPAAARDGSARAARAIMTTDPFPKEAAVVVETAHGRFHVGGMAKGSGMIEPRMATMLAVLTTDARVDPATLRAALADAASDTFNAITVDGECSTNDTVFALASGASGVSIDDSLVSALTAGLREVSRTLALEIVRGGEGATKLIAISVTGAPTREDAERAARTIANSPLVKTAVHGGDPNWGRLIAAAGRSGSPFVLDRAAVRIGSVVLFSNGLPFDERAPEAAAHMREPRVSIEVDLGAGGPHRATIWTCDLSADYVRINADYRT
jgi:glutamate N-acetyltransferase / amino-acid N-acetyltransferase